MYTNKEQLPAFVISALMTGGKPPPNNKDRLSAVFVVWWRWRELNRVRNRIHMGNLRVQPLVQHSPRATPKGKSGASVASFVMYEAKLTHITFTTVDAPSRTVVLPGGTAA